MGKNIAMLVLMVLMLGAAVWQGIYVCSATDTLSGQLEEVIGALESNDTEKAAQAASEFDDAWQRQKLSYEALFEHKEVDIISATSKKLPSLCTPSCIPEALAAAQEILFYIEHIKDIDRLGWENIL